jgi:hypothetical protein
MRWKVAVGGLTGSHSRLCQLAVRRANALEPVEHLGQRLGHGLRLEAFRLLTHSREVGVVFL